MPHEPLTILMLHAYYRQAGGEDMSALIEAEGLRRRGHRVDLMTFGPPTASSAFGAVWNLHAAGRVQAAVRKGGYDVVHAQNLFPAASASVLKAARRSGAAVVGTVRNGRLVCPAGTLWDGIQARPCTGCATGPFTGIWRGCWNGSRLATGVSALAQRIARRQWQRLDGVITPSAFLRDQVAAVLPGQAITVIPNQVADIPPSDQPRRGVVFAGRLCPEKGIAVFLEAVRHLPPTVPVSIFGDGPDAPSVQAAERSGLRWEGAASHPRVLAAMSRAAVVVVPSVWPEPFGRTALEGMAAGAAVVASRCGGLPEVIGDAGILVPPGDCNALGAAILEAVADHRALGAAGRDRYAALFADAAARLETAYRQAVQGRHERT